MAEASACLWDAFGNYSCGASGPGAGGGGVTWYDSADGKEGFTAEPKPRPALARAAMRHTVPTPMAPSREGFCSCAGNGGSRS